MQNNQTLAKSLNILAHPLSISVIGLYAFNTFIFQVFWPSWWTGKIGDFAWLFFFPYVLSALFAFLLPEKWKENSFALAATVVAALFVLVKTTVFNDFAVSSLSFFLHFPVSLVPDPTDLIALLSLVGAVFFWKKYQPSTRHQKFGLVLISLTVLFTLADSAMPDYGLNYLEISENTIVACSNYATYQSDDGGLTWKESAPDSRKTNCPYYKENLVISDPQNADIRYRYTPGMIERSTDGGKAWTTDYTWQPLSEADRIYYQTKNQSHYPYSSPPTYALADPKTGNVIFAMGQEGILVRQGGANENSSYSWKSLGPYQKIQFAKGNLLPGLISGELIMAVLIGGLGITLLSLRLKMNIVKLIFLILAIIGWVIVAFAFPPALLFVSSYSGIYSLAGIAVVGLLTLILTIFSLFTAGMNSRVSLGWFLIFLLLIPLVFICPFVLWVFDIIPAYYLTLSIASGLVAALLIFLWFMFPTWIARANTDSLTES